MEILQIIYKKNQRIGSDESLRSHHEGKNATFVDYVIHSQESDFDICTMEDPKIFDEVISCPQLLNS